MTVYKENIIPPERITLDEKIEKGKKKKVK